MMPQNKMTFPHSTTDQSLNARKEKSFIIYLLILYEYTAVIPIVSTKTILTRIIAN